MKKISHIQLVKDLLKKKGAYPVTIVSVTQEHNLRASNDEGKNPYWAAHKAGRLLKRSEVNGMLNWSYGNSVNNQRVREGQPLLEDGIHIEHFEPLPRSWGERVPKTPFVRHKGQVYIEMKVQKSLNWRYELDGEPIDKELILPYVAKKKESARQRVDNPIILRDYKLENILEIRYNNEIYSLSV